MKRLTQKQLMQSVYRCGMVHLLLHAQDSQIFRARALSWRGECQYLSFDQYVTSSFASPQPTLESTIERMFNFDKKHGYTIIEIRNKWMKLVWDNKKGMRK